MLCSLCCILHNMTLILCRFLKFVYIHLQRFLLSLRGTGTEAYRHRPIQTTARNGLCRCLTIYIEIIIIFDLLDNFYKMGYNF